MTRMLRNLPVVLAYTAATLTVVAAVLTPFLLMNWFTRGVAALGVRVDPVYSGGEAAYTVTTPGYRIVVNHPVVPKALLPTVPAFVQIAWEPVSALPARVSDEVDVDDDGRPDLVASFAVPRDPDAELRVDVTPLTSRVTPMRGVRRDSFASLITRIGDRIVVRVPLGEWKP